MSTNPYNEKRVIYKKDDAIGNTEKTPVKVRETWNAGELYALLQDPDLTWEVANALGRMGESGIDYLMAGLKDTNSYIRLNCARVLAQIKNPKTVEALIAALNDEDWDVQGYVAKALGEIGDPRAIEPLSRLLEEEPEGYDAGEALLKFGDKGIETLLQALKSTDPITRLTASTALGKTRDPKTLQPLIELLQDSDEQVRHSAASALGERKEIQAVDSLIKALQDKSPYVRMAVIESLQKITGQNFG